MASYRTIPVAFTTAADGISSAVDLGDESFRGFIAPLNSGFWTTAALTFLTAPSLNGTYGSVYDEAGTELIMNVPLSRYVSSGDLLATKLRWLRFLKLRSGTTAVPVQQASARTISIIACANPMGASRTIPITITAAADGQSNVVDLEEFCLGGVIISAAWTAGALSFLSSPTLTGTYAAIYDDGGSEITIASGNVVAGRTILFTDTLAKKFRAVRFLKVRSGLAAAPVQQAAPRLLTLFAGK